MELVMRMVVIAALVAPLVVMALRRHRQGPVPRGVERRMERAVGRTRRLELRG
ncbi:hypothetical protein NKG05_24490 [Oerskovia sp. M15]